jgi:hypothetical protein
MPKPNDSWTVKQLKDYVRSHGLNTFGNNIRLNMRKGELQGRLKAIGHWEGTKTKAQRRAEMTKGHVPGQKKRPKLPKRPDPRRARLKAGGKGTRAPITTAYQKARGELKAGNNKK